MTLYENVRTVAKTRGLSLQDVASKAGIGINSIYQWKDKTPSTDRLKAVADVLGVSTDYLLGNTDDPMPNSDVQQANPEVAIPGLFRRYAEAQGMNSEQSEQFNKEMQEYMAFRANMIKEIRNDTK